MTDNNRHLGKISAAIYLVTGFFTDQEPLKWRLRSLSADLASEQIKDKNAVLRELTSFFGIAKTAGLISDANHEILTNEFSRAIQELEIPLLPLLKAEKTVEPLSTLPATEPQTPQVIKDISSPKLHEDKPTLKEFGAVSVKKNSRQSTIIALLKRKKEIMIKDVSPLISGCSEKTIQRELSEMVAAGILTKIGEKRWTRYTLA